MLSNECTQLRIAADQVAPCSGNRRQPARASVSRRVMIEIDPIENKKMCSSAMKVLVYGVDSIEDLPVQYHIFKPSSTGVL